MSVEKLTNWRPESNNWKEIKMSNWIANRIKEGSTHQGAIVVAAAVAVIWVAIPLTKVILWGALAWGIWSILKEN